jgi:HEAT repeat protein
MAGELVAINDELAAVLLSIVADPADSEAVRGQSAIALGPVLEQGSITEFDDPDDVPISEETFERIQFELARLFVDESIPKFVRRRILEAAVRDPQEWQKAAILSAYNSGDRDWKLTAVFSMGYVRGFDKQILEALKSSDPDIHVEAVDAAGTWEMTEAYDHILALVENPRTPKALLLIAIAALGSIRPSEAASVLAPFLDSEDEDIRDAAGEALEFAEMHEPGEDDEGEDWVN